MIDILALILRLRALKAECPDVDCDPDADIAWAEKLGPPADAEDFALEIVFVICNSGMRFTVARGIYERVRVALQAGQPVREVFGHPGKADAIERIWRNRVELLRIYLSVADGWKLAWIEGLPWIGEITKYHVAKNLGLQYAKPDVHLQRLAETFSTTPQQLCEDLAKASGYKVATVDTLLWRAAAVGVLNTRTGALSSFNQTA